MFRGRNLGRASRGAGLLGLALTISVAALFSTASAVIYLPDPTEAVFHATVAPAGLPAHEKAPVSLAVAETIRNPAGGPPPALQELELQLGRHLALSVEGVPTCHLKARHPQAHSIAIPKRCREAKIGSGQIGIEVAFPEDSPIPLKAEVSAYNGGVDRGHTTTFWLYVSSSLPAGNFVVPLRFRSGSSDRFGLKGELKMPQIASGYGWENYLELYFRKGIFSASCPTGSSQARGLAWFVDGTTVQGSSTQTCRASASG